MCQKAEVIPDCRDKEGQHIGFYSEFSTKANEVVMVKAGISYVSIEGARANLAAEISDWDFDRIRQQARDSWVKAVDNLAVEGGTEDHKTFSIAPFIARCFSPRYSQMWMGVIQEVITSPINRVPLLTGRSLAVGTVIVASIRC